MAPEALPPARLTTHGSHVKSTWSYVVAAGRMFALYSRRPGPGALCQAAIAILCLAGSVRAQSALSRELRVKATYLLNFARFVEWPASAQPSASAPLPVCVMGDDGFAEVLDQTVAGKTAAGRSLLVRRVDSYQEECRVLYWDENEGRGPDLPRDAPVLTVSGGAGESQQEAMIRFRIIDQRVRFDVDLGFTERAGLKLSSQLLKVAATTAGRRK
jgi:hypothetical protein